MNAASILPSPAPIVLDLEAAFARLPAHARAQVQWARRPIDRALERLCTEPLLDALVEEVSAEVAKPLQAVAMAAAQSIALSSDDARASLMQDLQREEDLLVRFLCDEDSKDSLRWALGLLRSFYQYTTQVPRETLASMSEAAWSEAYADPNLTHLMRAVVALMAAAEVAKQAGDPARAGDLVDAAFLELSTFRQLAQKVSRVLAPFPFETLEDRRQRLLTCADRLRATLSESDWTAIETGRMHDLR